MSFSKQLIHWYLQYDRQLPWRESKDPYKIWLSEIILQQTRVAQGMPYYHAFIDAFPTVYDLAKADEQTVLKLWQGLGYYSRARNLHKAAKQIVDDFGGSFPSTYSELKTLKGVGDYTASAISSICFNEPHAVVDGNVYRVLARYLGIDTPINTTQGVRIFKKAAQELLDSQEPGIYNQAIMDFGALHCKPQNPLCDTCPFMSSCAAFAQNKVTDLPQKEKKLRIKKRYFNYLVCIDAQKNIKLQQRTGKGIWQGLYEFPLIETTTEATLDDIQTHQQYKTLNIEDATLTLYNEAPQVHKLSHQHLWTQFWIVEASNVFKEGVSITELHQYPVPILLAKFIDQFLKTRY